MIDRYLRSIYIRLAGVIVLVVAAALLATAALSHRAFERALAPEMATKVAVVGATVRSLMFKAEENGIDFHELYGIEQVIDDVRKVTPEIASFAVTDANGRVLRQHMLLQYGQQAIEGDAIGPGTMVPARLQGERRIAREDGVRADGVVHEARAHEHRLDLVRIVVVPDPRLHDVHVVERMGRMEKGVRVLQHVDEIGLEAHGHGIADIEDAGAALEQAHDRGVDVERAAPDDRLGQDVELALARRLVGTLGDRGLARQLHAADRADLGPQAVQARRASEVRHDGVDQLLGIVPAQVVGDVLPCHGQINDRAAGAARGHFEQEFVWLALGRKMIVVGASVLSE